MHTVFMGLRVLALSAVLVAGGRTLAQVDDRIVYVTTAAGTADIALMNADGTGVQLLSANPAADETQPAWSPDRQQIAFISNQSGSPEVFVMRVDGSGLRQISADGAYAETPSWSPDGQQLVYASARGGDVRLYLISLNNAAPIALTDGDAEDRYPAWSPNGQQIAFASNRRGNFEIYVMDRGGSNLDLLTVIPDADNISPAWSPDGTQLAFVSQYGRDAEISVMRADGSALRPVTAEDNFFANAVTWSPDGQTLAYMVSNSGGEHYIQTVGVSSFASTRLMADAEYPAWMSPRPVSIMAVANTGEVNPQLAGVAVSNGASSSLGGRVDTNYLNVRTGPGPEYPELETLRSGSTLTLSGRNADGSWGQLVASGTQWVNLRYVRVNGDIASLPVTFVEQGGWGAAGQIIGVRGVAQDVLRIRGGPSTDFQQLSDPDTLRSGVSVDLVGQSADGQWFQVDVGGRTGWVRAEYVTVTSGNRSSLPITG